VHRDTPLAQLLKSVDFKKEIKQIDVTPPEKTSEHLRESYIFCDFAERDYYLYYLVYKYRGKSLVFVNSVQASRHVMSVLKALKVECVSLQGRMEQSRRLRNLDTLKSEHDIVMVATDVAARGLDIKNLRHVIHYQVPRTPQLYVHRSGRTARFNAEGISVLLVTPLEYKKLFYISTSLSKEKEKKIKEFPVDELLMKPIKERVDLARNIYKLTAVPKEERETNRLITGLDLKKEDLADLLSEDEEEQEKRKKNRKVAKNARGELGKILKKPLIPRGTERNFYTKETQNLIYAEANAVEDIQKKASKRSKKGFQYKE